MAKEDIPSTCDNEMYDVSLYTLEGVHFFLLGKKQDADSTNCPSNIAMDQPGIGRDKMIASMFMQDIEDLPKHYLG